jgi:hypothetical protein
MFDVEDTKCKMHMLDIWDKILYIVHMYIAISTPVDAWFLRCDKEDS